MTDSDPYDLLISAGRVLCSACWLDGPGAVAVRGDRIAAAGPLVSGPARTRLDFPDGLLLPGLSTSTPIRRAADLATASTRTGTCCRAA